MQQRSNGPDHGPVKAGQEGIGFLVNQTSRAFNAHMTETIKHYGLDTDGYTVLRHIVREIEEAPGGVPVSDLSRKLNISERGLAATSRGLERDGWLTITVTQDELLLVPSRRAYSVVPVLVDASRWMLEGALNGFSHYEIDRLGAMLKRILGNLDAAVGEDEGPLRP